MTVKAVQLNPSPETNWETCSIIIAELLAPADEDSLIAWIARMGVLVAKRERDGDVAELELLAYAQKLREWPADIVHEVLNRYPDKHNWWPEWATLRAMLADTASERMALATAYRNWISAPEFMARREGIAPPPEPPKMIVTKPHDVVAPEAPALPIENWTPEEIDARRRAMKAAIEGGKHD